MADPATATAGIVILLMMMMGAGGKTKAKGCPPFKFDRAKVDVAIAGAIAAGMRGRETVATAVASASWPTHPTTGVALQWPPRPNASSAVKCLWGLLLKRIDKYLSDHGLPPWPDCPPNLPNLNLAAQRCEPAPEPPLPPPGAVTPFDPTEWETPLDADYPTPGTLLQLRYGDRLLGNFSPSNTGSDEDGQALRSIAFTTLLTAGFMAAKEFGGLSDEDAREFARDVANDNNNRIEYVNLIQCSPLNDAVYATYGFGPKAWESPAGRALRLLPYHFNNRDRLMLGLGFRRNMSLGVSADKNRGTSYGLDPGQRNFAYIWLPKINLQLLWESGGLDVTTQGVTWADGSNGIMPPPEVLAYGVEDIPESIAWGCLGYEAESVGGQ